MEIKDIALVLTGGAANGRRLALAARLGHEHGALVTGVFCTGSPPSPPSEGYAIGQVAVAEVVDREARRVHDLAAPTEAAFRQAMQAEQASCAWDEPAVDELAETTALRARTADLAILGSEDVALADALVSAGWAPCLITPETGRESRSFDQIILAWNGSREAKRALDDGLVFLKRARAVEVVVADEPGRPVGAPQTQALLAHLARHGVQASLCRTPRSDGRPAEALRRRCEAFGADLLIMGAFTHSRTVEMIFGGVTRSMLSDPPIPVLACR